MLIFPADTLQPIGIDSWIGAVLLLGMLALVVASCWEADQKSDPHGDDHISVVNDFQSGRSNEAKSKAYLTECRKNNANATSNCSLPASPGTGSAAVWTIEKTMRVMTSIVVLLAAIYIIIFDQEANADRQKWAFGAVGLVFGHWARR